MMSDEGRNRSRRIWRWAAIALISVAVVLILVHVVILPAIVRNRFGALLREAGLEGVTFRVPLATASSARIVDVRVGDGAARIDRITVRYGVGGIRRGQLDALVIKGLHLPIGVDEKGKINLGALAPLLAPKSNRAAASMPATMRTTPVPIVRIEIAESEVIVNSRSEKFALPLAGTAVGAENYRYLMDFQTELGGPVVLSGSLTPGTGVMRLNLSADDADAAKVSRLARAFAPGADVGVAGRLRTRVSFEWDGRTAGLSAQLEAKPTSADAVAAKGSVGEAGANVVVTGGVFHVEASLGEGGDSVKLLVRDAAFTERSQTLDVQGIGGNVELTSLAPLKSKPNQRVRVARFKAGDTELTGGRVQFEVMNSQLIHVEQTQWTWLGGEVRADDFAVQAGRMSVNLVAKDLDLAQLLKTFAQGKASGEGKVSGSMVINIDGANVALGQGHLSAMRDGKLQIAEDVAKQIAPPQGNKSVQEQVGQNIAEALKDFQFISLTAEMGPEDRGRMDAKIRGRGATGAKQEITYEPRVTGLNDLLGLVLHVRSAMSAGENAGGKAN